jgi:hypothetical protein
MAMNETLVKTHLIITDIHEEYHIDWCGSIANTQPVIENGKPVFIIRSRSMGGIEVNTTDMKYLEDIAKRMTAPKGRAAVTTDTTNIYIKQIDGTEKLLGTVIHDHIKHFAPMYDKVYCR